MNVLITGAAGFAGSHLIERLLLDGQYNIFGIVRSREAIKNIAHLEHQIHLIKCELKDFSIVKHAIDDSRPDVIFHLAAKTYIPDSFNDPANVLVNNTAPEINIFESVKTLKLNPLILVASSSEVYGKVLANEVPLTESQELRPGNTYAVSKVTQEYLARQYHQSYGLKTIVTRTFNHTGPRRGQQFVESNFTKQFVEMKKGTRKPELQVGNLESLRDFTDVRDVIRAYVMLANQGIPGETYQIASNHAIPIYSIVDMLAEITGIHPEIVQDPERMRPSDTPILVGNYEKLHRLTGWTPTIPLKKTLEDLVSYWESEA